MSFLEITPQQTTGLQVKSWLDSLDSHIEAAQSYYDSLINWLEVAQTNPEYTEEDKLALDKKLSDAKIKIKSLIPDKIK